MAFEFMRAMGRGNNPRRTPDRMTMQIMAALGRGGDTRMAHVTPGEAVIPVGTMTPELFSAWQSALDRKGLNPEQYVVNSEQASINPMTGAQEFQAGGMQSGLGSARDDRERSRAERGGSSNPTGTDARESRGSFPASPEMGGSQARRQQQQMIEQVPQERWAMEGGEFGQMRTADLGPLVDLFVPGPAQALMDLTDTPTEFDYFDAMPGHGTTGHEFNVGPESRERPMQGMAGQRQATAQAFARPAASLIPESLGLSLGGMSPLQMRSHIASQAVAGGQGQYFSPEAQAYYDNLLQRALIDDAGNLLDMDDLLPIEMQYLQQVRGLTGFDTTESLLNLIANQ